MIIPRGRRRDDDSLLDATQWRHKTGDDLDENERDHDNLRKEMRALVAPIQSAVDNTNRILIGVLITLATAAVIGALNLVITRG